MELILVIISLIIIAIGYLLVYNPKLPTTLNIIGGCLVCLGVINMALVLKIDSKPKAIEVYQGKTELKTTSKYINGELVKADSIVVYKKY